MMPDDMIPGEGIFSYIRRTQGDNATYKPMTPQETIEFIMSTMHNRAPGKMIWITGTSGEPNIWKYPLTPDKCFKKIDDETEGQ